jgi:hypothetical protein
MTPSVDQVITAVRILGTTDWKGALDALEHPTFDSAVNDVELALKIVGIFFPPAAQAELIIEVLKLLIDSGILGRHRQTRRRSADTGNVEGNRARRRVHHSLRGFS